MLSAFSLARSLARSLALNLTPPPPQHTQVALLYHAADATSPPAWPDAAGRLTTHPVDLDSGEGLDDALAAIGGRAIAAVINAAALSSPAACEADPDGAARINVPSLLLAALGRAGAMTASPPPLFIQVSTDQVYAGEGAPAGGWAEGGGVVAPVNAYARTKAAAEAAVAGAWPSGRHLSLRCSVMVGALPPAWPLSPPGRVPFLQFAAAAVREAGTAGDDAQTGTAFFADEWRSFVGVRDVARVCLQAVDAAAAGKKLPPVLNVGGPARLSRADLARSVAVALGVPPSVVREASAGGSTRVPSPADIGMDVGLLRRELGFEPRPLEAVIREELFVEEK